MKDKYTPLEKKVYNFLKTIPKGKVITYGDLAKAVGANGAARFIGNCMKSNEDPEGIPCYKVVKSDGFVGEYSADGGVIDKVKKLRADGVEVKDGKIDLEKYGWKV